MKNLSTQTEFLGVSINQWNSKGQPFGYHVTVNKSGNTWMLDFYAPQNNAEQCYGYKSSELKMKNYFKSVLTSNGTIK